MNEQRDRLRQAIKKLAFVKSGEMARGGLLRDISAAGLGLDFVNPMGKVEHTFCAGDDIEIVIDGFQPLRGHVVRTEMTGIFAAFDLNRMEEKALIAEIMEAG